MLVKENIQILPNFQQILFKFVPYIVKVVHKKVVKKVFKHF
jgi:hypothetical protein